MHSFLPQTEWGYGGATKCMRAVCAITLDGKNSLLMQDSDDSVALPGIPDQKTCSSGVKKDRYPTRLGFRDECRVAYLLNIRILGPVAPLTGQ